jgi:basic membrane protein A
VNGLVADASAGNLAVFNGPITDQDGTVRVEEGATLSDEELGNVDWFVIGVTGSPK